MAEKALLKDLLTHTRDGDWGPEAPKPGCVPYKVIRGADFPGARFGDIADAPVCYLDPEVAARKRLQDWDLIIETAGGNRDRPTGRTVLIKPSLLKSTELPVTCASFSRFLRVDPSKADAHFLYWHLQHLHASGAMWEHQVQHTGVARFQYTRFAETVPIPLPPLPEQRAIAWVLGALDDKIEVNRKTARVLEGIVRAVFTSWFVDFDPVRRHPHPPHAAASHPGSAAVQSASRPAPLPADLAALFPTRLVNSPIGEVPEGWRVGTLAEVCEKPQYGLTASAADEAVGPKFLRITDINKEPWINWTSVPFCEIPAGEDAAKYRLRKGDLVIARMADPGHAALIEEDRDVVFASYLIRFRPRAAEAARYLQYWTRSTAYWALVHGRKTGSTRATLNATELGELPLLVPPAPALVQFAAIVDSLRARGVHAITQSATLAALRDALLPKLISGELRIADAERIVGRVTGG